MKKILKITGITVASIVALVLIVVSVAFYVVFTPERLTPIVRTQAQKFLTCHSSLDTVNFTFFSTFPNFALQINNLTLADSTNTQDTIAHFSKFNAEIDLSQFLFHNSIVINEIEFSDAFANLHVDSLGNTNYDIVNLPKTEEEKEDTTALTIFEKLQIGSIDIKNLSAKIVDDQAKLTAIADNLNIHIEGFIKDGSADADIALSLGTLAFDKNDSTQISANISKPEILATISMSDNHIEGNFATIFPSVTLVTKGDTLINAVPMDLNIPAEWNKDVSLVNLKDAHLIIGKLIFNLTGSAQFSDDKSIAMDVSIDAEKWDFDNIFALIPSAYSGFLNDFNALDGSITMTANAEGVYNDSTKPIFNAALLLENVTAHHKSQPDYKIEETTADMDVLLDLNNKSNSVVNIRKLYTRTGTTFIEASGSVNDFMNKVLMNLDLVVDVSLPELYPLVPKDLNIKMKGRTAMDIHLNTTLKDVKKKNLENITASGTIAYTDLDILYNDSIHIIDKKGSMNVSLPAKIENRQFDPIMSLDIKGSNIFFNMLGSVKVELKKPQLNVTITNPLDKSRMLAAAVYFDMDTLDFDMDTLTAKVMQPKGYASFMPSRKDPKKPLLTVAYVSDKLNINMGSALSLSSNKIDVKAFSRYNKEETKSFLKWNPVLLVDFNDGLLKMSSLKPEVKIPEIKFKFTPTDCKIENSRIILADSDFSLSGEITNIRNYIDKDELLKGDLNFVSENTNIDQLMDIFTGFGTDEAEELTMAENVDVTKAEDAKETTSPSEKKKEPRPFMVPKGVEIVFNTNIKNAVFNNTDLEHILGKLTVADGKVALEQMGFTAEAAEMQLSGMYRSDRSNHLFAGVNLHLLDIDIESLIDLIPDIDSIVPMLSSFEGSGEFHFVAETYLKSDYSPKMSTLRAAAAFEGKNLVVLDGEMFSTISKYLMFNKKTRNVVDSLAVEMTVLNSEIDVYPFLISMGKWQAVLSGRHNLDMSFDYHVSLTDCPLPLRLGLDVKSGPDGEMKFKIVPCKYKALYKPNKKKNMMQERALELKKTISDALKANVK